MDSGPGEKEVSAEEQAELKKRSEMSIKLVQLLVGDEKLTTEKALDILAVTVLYFFYNGDDPQKSEKNAQIELLNWMNHLLLAHYRMLEMRAKRQEG